MSIDEDAANLPEVDNDTLYLCRLFLQDVEYLGGPHEVSFPMVIDAYGYLPRYQDMRNKTKLMRVLVCVKGCPIENYVRLLDSFGVTASDQTRYRHTQQIIEDHNNTSQLRAEMENCSTANNNDNDGSENNAEDKV